MEEFTVGLDFLSDFLEVQYLDDYIPEGGSKIKMVTGRNGSGKTHFSRDFAGRARRAGFLTVSFSAKNVWIHDMREMYLEILGQCDIGQVLRGCAAEIVREMGYEPEKIGGQQTFMDYLSEIGEGDALSKSMIRTSLRRMFTKNPLLDNCFACCCSLLTGDILGHPMLEASSRDLIFRFLQGDKTVKLSQIRTLGLSPSRVTRFNARHLLRSLTEVIRLGGYKGLLVVIDDMDVLAGQQAEGTVRYTKLRRDDAYENIRQLIDDIDSMRYVMFLMCFDRELIDQESQGIKSYQALWMRVQNEVVSTRFNRFADILDMDRRADEVYKEEVLCEMADGMCKAFLAEGIPAESFDRETARELIDRANYGGIGLPGLVKDEVRRRGEEKNE